MECPNCFRRIIVPQPAADGSSKFILTASEARERPLPQAASTAALAEKTEPAGKLPFAAIAALFVVGVAVGVLISRGTFFKSSTGQTNQAAAVQEEKPAPSPLPARAIVVFARGNSIVLGSESSGAEVEDPARASFLAAFQADINNPAAFRGPLKLTGLPLAGRTVPGAGGQIRYHDRFPAGLVIIVTLEGLTPNHDYLLTLNGDPRHAGNEHLTQHMPNRREGYYDFSKVTTSANGRFDAIFGIRLPAGLYDVMFFVKDTTDWKIVLHHDFFRFTVD
jgi:hypothetical protein